MLKFKATYTVSDGYVGHRPQHFKIDESVIDMDMSEDDIRAIFNEEMDSAFAEKIMPHSTDEDKFVEWALEIQEKLKAEEDSGE